MSFCSVTKLPPTKINFHSFFRPLIHLLTCPESLTSDLLNDELQRCHDQINSRSSSGNDSLWSILKRPEIYKPLAIINAFFAFQQFSGTFVIVVYAAKFAEEAGTGIDKFLCTVLIGIARVIATIILAYFILDRYGRKPPSIFSGIGKHKFCGIIAEKYNNFPY